VLSGTLAIALVEAGWRLRAVPGEPLVLEGALGALDPFQTVDELPARQGRSGRLADPLRHVRAARDRARAAA